LVLTLFPLEADAIVLDQPLELGVYRQNSITSKSVDYSGRYVHTPTHDRGTAMAGIFD
jgi:hypothetical protein